MDEIICRLAGRYHFKHRLAKVLPRRVLGLAFHAWLILPDDDDKQSQST